MASFLQALLIGLLVCAYTLTCTSASAREAKTNQANAEAAISVVTEHWPPYNYTNEQGEIVGLATKVVKAVLADAGYDYNIQLLPWSRAFKLAQENSHTLIYTIYQSDNRLNKFQWICPIINTRGVNVYALSSRTDIAINSLDDARNYVIGTTKRSVMYGYLKSEGFELGKNLDIASDELANIRKLARGRIDLIIQDEQPFKLRVEKTGLPLTQFKKVHTLFADTTNKSCMAMSLSTPTEVVNKLQAALNKVLANNN